MNTIFMNSENSETSYPNRILINPTDNISPKRSDKYAALSNLSIYDTWEDVKRSYQNNKFKIILTPTWNEEF